MSHASKDEQVKIPPTSELFNADELARRHPNILNHNRVVWALRNRRENGLADAVFESRTGELVVHEPAFLAWFLGLQGRSKPRATHRRSSPAA